MKKLISLISCICMMLLYSCANVKPPEPIGPVPSQRQLDWQELEYYGFIHFNMNTFTDMEWGTGGESPETFNPTQLDARQWAKVAKEAGMKGLIITAKHHDGFSLWPTETTEHSVANSPYKNGQGDIIKELAEACREYDLKFGVYLSPWDRNHPEYGREEYVEVFHKQLEELLTSYGDIFEVWFDGANGGTGYYGGANEERTIDDKTYYQWDKVVEMIRKHQPEAVIFGGQGDVRWVGNEHGFAQETNWSTVQEDGTRWFPAEADVSIRPGWYYHKREDHLVKSLPHLLDIYYGSVGRNASLLLNLPVDDRGLVHENDIEQLMELRKKLDADFQTNLAMDIEVEADNTRENASKFAASNVIDGDKKTYWASQESRGDGSIILDFEEPTTFNRFLVQEYIPLGQRVKEFTLEAKIDNQWKEIDSQTTIGYKRILRFDPVTASALRLNIKDAKASPLISNIEVYNAPTLLVAPAVTRSKEGSIQITVPDENVRIFYSVDGSIPDKSSKEYTGSLAIYEPLEVKAIAYDPESTTYSEITSVKLDVPKTHWEVFSVSSGSQEEVGKIIDQSSSTWWSTDREAKLPQEVGIDLGQHYVLRGFSYFPPQERWTFGIISHYEFWVSSDSENWRQVASGEFGNIKNNPIEQTIHFPAIEGRYIKLKGVRTTDGSDAISIGEIGVIIDSNKN